MGQTKDTLEGLYLSARLGMSWCPPGGIGGSCLGEELLDLPVQTVAPTKGTWQKTKRKKTMIYSETLYYFKPDVIKAWRA